MTTLVLSPQGHIEHVLYGVDDGETFWAHTEPGAAGALVAWLDRMRFLMRVEVADRSDAVRGGLDRRRSAAVISWPGRGPDSLGGRSSSCPGTRSVGAGRAPRAGMWAYEARRIAAGVPRVGLDTDHRTIPNEVGLLGVAVHLDKGCYRGQETVARVHTLGRPPRRLVRLHLDGSADALPEPGTALELDGRAVGFVGGSARHYELGPIALGLVKRNVDPVDADCWSAASPPARRPWSTPRSACTSARSSTDPPLRRRAAGTYAAEVPLRHGSDRNLAMSRNLCYIGLGQARRR